MKKTILLITLVFGFNLVSAQSDVITKQIGEVLKGKIIKADDNTIVFTYDGQGTEYIIGKYAVAKIVYGKTGREEKTSNKIVVSGENDWSKVIVVENIDYTAGLEKGREIGTASNFISGDEIATKKLKMEAAKQGYPFVLISLDSASNRKATGYSY